MQQEMMMDSPPPYELEENGLYLSGMDLNAWPSSYYGRTRRIDLAKFYHDILKASTSHDDEDHDDQCSEDSTASSDDEEEAINQNNLVGVTSLPTNSNKKKTVTFTDEAPTVYEYEPEYDLVHHNKSSNNLMFDDGWPGRTKMAMKSTGFIDFKSKIEAKLGAINDPSLISELDKEDQIPLYRGYYRHRKSPLVNKLNLRPIPNNQPSLLLDNLPSPSNSYTDSPMTPRDIQTIPFIDEPSTSTGSKWLNRTLSRIRSTSSKSSSPK